MLMNGEEEFVDPFGNHEDGHLGNGCAKITVISAEPSLNIFPTCKQSRKQTVYLLFIYFYLFK